MIRVSGVNMNLAQYVRHRRKEYEGQPLWRWADEGIIHVIQDYESSCPYPDWSDEDKQYLVDNDLEEILDILDYKDALKDFHPIG